MQSGSLQTDSDDFCRHTSAGSSNYQGQGHRVGLCLSAQPDADEISRSTKSYGRLQRR